MRNHLRPNGELQGDDKPMPDRGTSTGFNGNTANLGADTSQSAINRQGGIGSATKSSKGDGPQCNELNKPGGC